MKNCPEVQHTVFHHSEVELADTITAILERFAF
jgi:hypothetical protein